MPFSFGLFGFFGFFFPIFLLLASEGRQRSQSSNPFTKTRKRGSGVVGCGLCTSIPLSAAKAQVRATSQTTYVLLTSEDKYLKA